MEETNGKNKEPKAPLNKEINKNEIHIIVLGPASVGKTSMVKRFVQGIFNGYHLPTIEDVYTKEIILHKISFTLKITDTAGSFLFPAIYRAYIQKGHAFILAYSIADSKSFDDLTPMLKDILDIKSAGLDRRNVNVPILIVGNKSDQESERRVPFAAGEKLALEHNCEFIEISSKKNTNINEAFSTLIKLKISPKTNNLIRTANRIQNSIANESVNKLSTNEECSIM